MVGSSIVRELESEGYKNIFKASKNELDLRDAVAVEKWFKTNNPDVTIIAAAKVGGIIANNTYPCDFLLDNLKIQNNLIENSFLNKVKRLLFLGSSCIYPKFAEQPIIEESLLTNFLEPTNQWYAIAKISGIKLCESLRIQHGFDAISLMPTNLYGRGDYYHVENSHVIPALIRKFYEAKQNNKNVVNCWGTGSPRREFLYVDDLAKACLFCLKFWDPENNDAPKTADGKSLCYLNVGTGKDVSIKELALQISYLIGFKGNIRWDKDMPDGTPKKQLNTEKINQLGWYPEINLEDGLKITINHFYEELESKQIRI